MKSGTSEEKLATDVSKPCSTHMIIQNLLEDPTENSSHTDTITLNPKEHHPPTLEERCQDLAQLKKLLTAEFKAKESKDRWMYYTPPTVILLLTIAWISQLVSRSNSIRELHDITINHTVAESCYDHFQAYLGSCQTSGNQTMLDLCARACDDLMLSQGLFMIFIVLDFSYIPLFLLFFTLLYRCDKEEHNRLQSQSLDRYSLELQNQLEKYPSLSTKMTVKAALQEIDEMLKKTKAELNSSTKKSTSVITYFSEVKNDLARPLLKDVPRANNYRTL